jgi:hypothetical protein
MAKLIVPGNLKRIFAQIRGDVAIATSREELTDLYRRAAYLVTLTYSPACEKKIRRGGRGTS